MVRIVLRILTLIIIGGIPSWVLGQGSLRISPVNSVEELVFGAGTKTTEFVFKTTVTNQQNTSVRIRWDKIEVYMPVTWEAQVCDKVGSYPAHVKTNYDPIQGIYAPVELAPGESFDLFVTIQTYGITGQAHVEIPMRSIGKSAQLLGTAQFKLTAVSSSDAPSEDAAKRIRTYPNPVRDRFFLAGEPPLSKLEIYNLLGSKVRTFYSPQSGDGFSIGDLPQGVYLISLYDAQGKVVRTMRIVRRDFRP